MVLRRCVSKKRSARGVGRATQGPEAKARAMWSGLGVISWYRVLKGLGQKEWNSTGGKGLNTHFLVRSPNGATVQSAQGEAALATRPQLEVPRQAGRQAGRAGVITPLQGTQLPGVVQGAAH